MRTMEELINILGDSQKRLMERLKKFEINTDIADRWEKGIEHHPQALELASALEALDWVFCSDFFCWKFGGDGDNGEFLLYELDIYFELLDKEAQAKMIEPEGYK
jgi:hypothetical protein